MNVAHWYYTSITDMSHIPLNIKCFQHFQYQTTMHTMQERKLLQWSRCRLSWSLELSFFSDFTRWGSTAKSVQQMKAAALTWNTTGISCKGLTLENGDLIILPAFGEAWRPIVLTDGFGPLLFQAFVWVALMSSWTRLHTFKPTVVSKMKSRRFQWWTTFHFVLFYSKWIHLYIKLYYVCFKDTQVTYCCYIGTWHLFSILGAIFRPILSN